MTANFPDLPASEIIQAQGPSAQAVGNRYAAIEYVEVLQRLPMGPQGPMGPTGPEGEDGAEWHTGAGDPNNNGTATTGPNDMYVDSDTGDVWYWEEVSQSWVNSGTSLAGPTGPQGIQGFTGDTGATGPMGPQGGGILIVGEFAGNGSQAPPFTGVAGEGWVDSVGNLWGWIPTPPPGYWYNYGPITGPTGPEGPGVITQRINFQFAPDPTNSMWATQAINHTLTNATPSVRTFIDLTHLGLSYSIDQTIGVSYPSPTQVLLTAEASIINHNGWGWVVLQ